MRTDERQDKKFEKGGEMRRRETRGDIGGAKVRKEKRKYKDMRQQR